MPGGALPTLAESAFLVDAASVHTNPRADLAWWNLRRRTIRVIEMFERLERTQQTHKHRRHQTTGQADPASALWERAPPALLQRQTELA